MKKIFELDFRGRKIIVENGELAKQAHGAVLVRYGDTVILSTAVVSKNANILSDFFPLMVLYLCCHVYSLIVPSCIFLL